MAATLSTRKKLSSFRIVILGFAAAITVGTVLLMLPISTRTHKPATLETAAFTATSATCVTGLVVRDTATYWSPFGQMVILVLIQMGGLGVVLAAATFGLLSGRKISLKERSMLRDSFAAKRMSGMVRLVTFILKITVCSELIGAAIMMPTFISHYGPRGVWIAIFLSISAFCNAGFDVLGRSDNLFPSLSSYATDPLICTVISMLIVFGGIGFVTWSDLREHGMHFKRYSMQTKVILTMTSVLIVLPAVFFFLFEYDNLPLQERLLCSGFQSITTRTAGFNVEDMSRVSEPSQALTIILMLIGASPGSTAGGVKTTTVAVLLSSFMSVSLRRNEAHLFDRRVNDGIIKQASAIFLMYVGLALLGGVIICLVEDLPYMSCLFECASALGTVGLSLGITPGLTGFSHALLCSLMFLGRAGGLTIIYAATKETKNVSKLPQEHISVG